MRTGKYIPWKVMLFVFCLGGTKACSNAVPEQRIPVIFDTDANNELDDQHALAYLVLNAGTFFVEGVTVNATYNGGSIHQHMQEAERVIQLCNVEGAFPLLKGAEQNFGNIVSTLETDTFDGFAAVDFIIQTALKYSPDEKLCLLPVGKLTNVALSIKKEPSIIPNLRVVWLGSNYPDAGEYNLENDTAALNFILNSGVEFEMAVCRYGKPSGTDHVKVSKALMLEKMPGAGPQLKKPVSGRHGGSFTHFGDYSVSLFEHCEFYGNPPSRALFDMAAVAIVKNPDWAEAKSVPAPLYKNGKWVERPHYPHLITVWENFYAEAILDDFFTTMKQN